ncbi:hypothetical protein E2C01_000870 [Portunus trituberculatus]|uniref:Uncharacterized protein n=1 Tax=Portunus trituberculatus TaxID=210409 RepID=A0A5B7CFG8_PORTR|nr:hypothetical protein [Portunus trituberculatus]
MKPRDSRAAEKMRGGNEVRAARPASSFIQPNDGAFLTFLYIYGSFKSILHPSSFSSSSYSCFSSSSSSSTSSFSSSSSSFSSSTSSFSSSTSYSSSSFSSSSFIASPLGQKHKHKHNFISGLVIADLQIPMLTARAEKQILVACTRKRDNSSSHYLVASGRE